MINNTKIQAEQGKVSLSANPLNEDQIQFLNIFVIGNWKYDKKTGLVDVNGNLDCSSKGLEDLKSIRFGYVSGNFDCYRNQLTSLEGAPQKVGGYFHCGFNQLTSLEGAPQKVRGDFNCNENQLTSLKGRPKEVGGDFDCSNNQLTSLEGAPQKVRGDFYCYGNQLTSLEGAPQEIGGCFNCSYNQLTSLEGAPQKVGRGFYFYDNQLTSQYRLGTIHKEMKGNGGDYLQALEKVWNSIPLEDQTYLYRENFKWISDEDSKKLKALKSFNKIKDLV